MKKLIIGLVLIVILTFTTNALQDPNPPIGGGDIDNGGITTFSDPNPPIG